MYLGMAGRPITTKASVTDEKPSTDNLDGIHDALEFPTEEERETLRRVPDTVPWSAYRELDQVIPSVLSLDSHVSDCFDRIGRAILVLLSQSLTSKTNFIQQKLPPGSHTGAGFTHGQSGALGKGQRASTGLTTFYQFWCYVTPLLGAYIADTYLGRFNTICIAVAIALLGHIILIVSAVPGVIENSDGALVVFIIALIVMGLGTGLFKSNISPLIAEQYKRTRLFVITTKKGERVIVDPAMTISRVYMASSVLSHKHLRLIPQNNSSISIFSSISVRLSVRLYVGFWLAYTLPTIIFLLCPIALFLGRNRYVRTPPTGSILLTAFRLWRYAAAGRWSLNPVKMYRQLTAPDFWENAKPSKLTSEKPKWMTFDDQWVDEFLETFIAGLAYNQLNNNLTSQAATMSTHGLPNDVLSNLDPLALVIFIPICDLIIYPALRRGGLNFSALRKITAGFFAGSAAMIWAAVVQHYIYKTNPCHYSAATCKDANQNALVSPLNVWIQTGSYVLIAFSEIFASITGLEYAFTKAPGNMRSLVMAVYLFTSAIAAALSEAFVSLSSDPLLVWNYGVMAVLASVTGVIFWLHVRKLDAQEDRLNNLAVNRVERTRGGVNAGL
ncbi:hypothetical protein C0989_003348 [Termitomyces sp. Mn162]|nr:hypothetical protein C0989_003348 [Termitomyces sp. Mn162]